MDTGALVVVALFIAFAGVLIGMMIATASAPDQARVTVADGELVVSPIGLMGLWALSKGVRVPLSEVATVAAVDRSTLPLGFRAPGAYLPGVICAGTYRRKGSKGLWMVGKAETVLDIELTGEGFTRVVLQVADPAATAATVNAARA